MAEHAVFDALEAYRQPARLRYWKTGQLPRGTLDIIKICAGDRETMDMWSAMSATKESELREASSFFLNHLIRAAGKDNYLLLCLSRSATLQDVKTHKRWLLKWLHPDVNPSAWESALFRRISEAAKNIENSRDPGDQQAGAIGLPAFTTKTRLPQRDVSLPIRFRSGPNAERRFPVKTRPSKFSSLFHRLDAKFGHSFHSSGSLCLVPVRFSLFLP